MVEQVLFQTPYQRDTCKAMLTENPRAELSHRNGLQTPFASFVAKTKEGAAGNTKHFVPGMRIWTSPKSREKLFGSSEPYPLFTLFIAKGISNSIFFAPNLLKEEIKRHQNKIIEVSKSLDQASFELIRDEIFSCVSLISEEQVPYAFYNLLKSYKASEYNTQIN